MKLYVLKEVKNGENRVSMTPSGVRELTGFGHTVYVETGAGVGSGYSDLDYQNAGAAIVQPNSTQEFNEAELFVKVKEPVSEEYDKLKLMSGKTLLTYLHLSDNPELARKLVENNITGVSYDTLEDESGRLPLLKPMSEIAGKFAIDFWQDDINKRKIKKALIIGGGVAGQAAATRAVDLGIPDVVIYEPVVMKAADLREKFEDSQVDVFACNLKLPKEVIKTDLLVGCALVKGARAPMVVGPDLIDLMAAGSRIIDISIDQGGCIWGSRPTSHSNPTYVLNDKVYCCIPNMPGARPVEATEALTKETLPHIVGMANKGIMNYLESSPGLYKAINVHSGKIVHNVVLTELEKCSKGCRDS